MADWMPTIGYYDPLFGNSSLYVTAYQNLYNQSVSFIAAQASATSLVLQLGIQRSQSLNHSIIASVNLFCCFSSWTKKKKIDRKRLLFRVYWE